MNANTFGFAPDGDRGLLLDRRMRSLLAESLEHICDRCERSIHVDYAAVRKVAVGLHDGQRYPPALYGLYQDTVLAIAREDLESAAECLDRIGHEHPLDAAPQVISLDAPALAGHRRLLLDTLAAEASAGCRISDPGPAAAEVFGARLAAARRLMVQALPDLAAEFDALATQVILVGSDPTSPLQFDGGSSYMLWGGLFLNVDFHPDEVALVEVLAHESGHLLLFGFAADEPLVNNDDEARYSSPLRIDPRPMDGIYHATYVSARMYWAMDRLLECGLLDDAGRETAKAARAADAKNFVDGYAVISAHGDLTATGAAVMDRARLFMEPHLQDIG